MYLLTAALRQEISLFKKRLLVASHRIFPRSQFLRGRLGDREWGIFLTSVAPPAARLHAALSAALSGVSVKAAILSGFCGALQPGMWAGDLVLSPELLPPPGSGSPALSGDASLLSELRKALAKSALPFHEGRGITVHTPLGDPEEKERLGRMSGALAVDMENYALAQFFSERGIPFAVLRSVLDPMDCALSPAICQLVDAEGDFRPKEGLRTLFTHPRELFRLPAFARQAELARRSLDRFFSEWV